MNSSSLNTQQESSSSRRRPQSISPCSSSSSAISRVPSSVTSTVSIPAYSTFLAAPNSPPRVVSFTSRIQSDKLQSSSQVISPAVSSLPGMRILAAVSGIVGIPLAFYGFQLYPESSGGLLWQIRNVWSAQLRVDMLYVAFFALCLSVYLGDQCNLNGFNTAAMAVASTAAPASTSTTRRTGNSEQPLQHQLSRDGCLLLHQDPHCVRWGRRISRASGMLISRRAAQACLKRLRAGVMTVEGLALSMTILVILIGLTTKSFPILIPSWIYYPFALFNYKVYSTSDLVPALQGMCPDLTPRERELQEEPLCLSEDQWQTLSAGKISSNDHRDVRAVYQGVDYARHESGGLVIAVLARDVQHHLTAFRENVEALHHFFPNLAVVVFENDSKDGSRQVLKEWVADTQHNRNGYHVELLDCEEARDCKFGHEHRDTDRGDFYLSKAVGAMDTYRNRVKDHIIGSPRYKDFSHMLVTDVDLEISLSPLGILHSLGGHYRDNAVATSGHFLLVDAFGTLTIPYDMSAFVPQSNELNHFTLSLHERWCSLAPPDHRWANICDASSMMKLSEIMRVDQGNDGDYYEVESAFNGAVLYPLSVVRESDSSYDAGEYGQRCEHIGFNLGLRKPMYVSRKWGMHVDPLHPGGPTGWRAEAVFRYVESTPRLIIPMILHNLLAYFVFLHCFITVGIFLVYPLLAPLLVGAKSWRLSVVSPRRRRRLFFSQASTAEPSAAEETLLKIV